VSSVQAATLSGGLDSARMAWSREAALAMLGGVAGRAVAPVAAPAAGSGS
jgi:hypothetical protein